MAADPHSPFIKWPPDSSVPMPPLQLGPTAEANARGYQPSVYGGSHAASPGSVPGLTPSNTHARVDICPLHLSIINNASPVCPPGFSPSAYFSPSLYPAEPSPSVPEDMPVLVTRVDGLRYGFKEDPDGVKWFHCLHPGCNERYKNRVGNLKDHQRRIHDPTFEPFRCTQCSATYSRPNALKNHKSKMHGHLLDSNPPIPASVNNSR
ncbi:hypothetical protein BD413DRAFT_584663 [Trametes elegans]|nr:hypothetical protein BD413DRAFT_584663 [Trametes elegans]